MPSWVLVVLIVVIVLAVGFLREHLRTGAIRRWCQTRGFEYVIETPTETATLTALAKRFRPSNVGQLGVVLRKNDAGAEWIITEYAVKPMRSGERWYTIIAVKIPGMRFDAVRIVPAPSTTGRRVMDAVMTPGVAAQKRLGIEVTEVPPLHSIGSGKWAIEAEDAAVLSFWQSGAQSAVLDAWADDVALATIDGYVLMNVSGLVSPSRLDKLLQRAAEARTLFKRAAADRGAR
jgi:hypothetical protein